MIPKDVCEKVFTWNPSNCECECDKSFDVGEYLDYENCKCRKKLLDKLVEECTETVEEVKLAKITSAERKNRCGCSSCTLYTVLFSVLLTIRNWYLLCLLQIHESLLPKKVVTSVKFGIRTQTTI